MRSSHRPFESIDAVPFDSEKWRNLGPFDFGELRLAMARDLLTTKVLIGKPRTEVLSLLGNRGSGADPLGELRYELNEEHRGGNIDPTDIDYLVVGFGPDERVTEVRHEEWHDSNR